MSLFATVVCVCVLCSGSVCRTGFQSCPWWFHRRACSLPQTRPGNPVSPLTVSTVPRVSPDSLNKCCDFKSCWIRRNFPNFVKHCLYLGQHGTCLSQWWTCLCAHRAGSDIWSQVVTIPGVNQWGLNHGSPEGKATFFALSHHHICSCECSGGGRTKNDFTGSNTNIFLWQKLKIGSPEKVNLTSRRGFCTKPSDVKVINKCRWKFRTFSEVWSEAVVDSVEKILKTPVKQRFNFIRLLTWINFLLLFWKVCCY